MTKQELASEVKRRSRHLNVLARLVLVAMFGPVIAAICVVLRPGYRPEEQGGLVLTLWGSAPLVPLLCAIIFLRIGGITKI